MNLEGAGAFWLDSPQSDRFNPGAYLAVRPGVSFGPGIVALQWSYATIVVPAGEEFTRSGSAHFLTAGLRLRPLATRSQPEDTLAGLWLDGNIGYVRTEQLDRLGFDAGLGYNFQVTPGFGLGPFVRYVHVVQPDDNAGQDPNDAQLLAVGVTLAFGPAHRERIPLDCPECVQEDPVCEPALEPACSNCEPALEPACSDYDGDTVCDDADRCPVTAGPSSTWGCPIDPCGGAPLTVLVQFNLDSSGMPAHQDTGPQTMDPVLDAVAEAIGQDPSCRVCIVGHASSDGGAEHNQRLSVTRAEAVQDYMTVQGVDESRIPTVGMGEMCPLIPQVGQVMNRRVEFRRLADGESCPTTCSQ